LTGVWELIRVWGKEKPPARAIPFVLGFIVALSALAIAVHHLDIALCAMDGFEALLRAGELFRVRASHISFLGGSVVTKLVGARTGQANGAGQVVVIKLCIVFTYVQSLGADALLPTCSPAVVRTHLQQLLWFMI
jgi:hypothetical protein